MFIFAHNNHIIVNIAKNNSCLVRLKNIKKSVVNYSLNVSIVSKYYLIK